MVEPRYVWELSPAGLRLNAFELIAAAVWVSEEYDRAICSGVNHHTGDAVPLGQDELAASARYARDAIDEAHAIAADLGADAETVCVAMAEVDDMPEAHCRAYGERSGWSEVLRQRMRCKALRAAQKRAKGVRACVFA
jgi:hypothetical protein